MLKVSDLQFSYTSDQHALKGVDFALRRRERLGIVGGNGSGKTTLARLCCGLLVPTAGSVNVDGIDTRDTRLIHQVRRKVGLVFQDPDDQLVETTVEREIAFGLRNIGLSYEEVTNRLAEALRLFNLESLRRRPCGLLSAGEKQLINLASVLAMQPDYIILDESTAFLDNPSRLNLTGALGKLLEMTGAGLIFISNRLEDIWFCERIGFLDDGRFSFLGSKADFLTFLFETDTPLYGILRLLRELRDGIPDIVSRISFCATLDPEEIARSIVDINGGGNFGNRS